MANKQHQHLSKRERQIMDIIYRMGEASVAEVLERLPDPPGYNSARMLMNILERKGHLHHRNEKNKYIYFASLKKDEAKNIAAASVIKSWIDFCQS